MASHLLTRMNKYNKNALNKYFLSIFYVVKEEGCEGGAI